MGVLRPGTGATRLSFSYPDEELQEETMIARILAAVAFGWALGAAEASAASPLPDLDQVQVAYMRHGHHYGRHHVSYRRVHHRRYGYRPVRIVRYHRPHRYGHYRRVYRPYGYYGYRPHGWGRHHRPYGYGYGYGRPRRGVSISVGF